MTPNTLFAFAWSAAALFSIIDSHAVDSATVKATNQIAVHVGKPGAEVSPYLWGIFFEDINLSADGGIVPERVRNRSFEDGGKVDPWSVIANASAKVDMSIESDQPVSAKNPHSLKVTISNTGSERAGIANPGYYGMSFEKGEDYFVSFFARAMAPFKGPLTITLESTNGMVIAKEEIKSLTDTWAPYSFELCAKKTDPVARLVISTTSSGTFCLDMVSVMPETTWKDHGLRPDLCEMLAGLKPTFMRFPGGCWVEGTTMAEAYRWKQTIGDLSERRTQFNLWQYHATHALGYHEYLQLSEDLKAEPLFCINVGMSHKENVPMDKMGEYVQDALDAIEYANGPVTSTWGAVRAKAGHPKPFNLKFLEIGNENGGPAYHERYALFNDAIKARYPEIKLIANHWSGGYPKNRPIEIVDEHYYSNPEFFMNHASKYDSYDRKGHKVFVGEYAVTRNTGEGSLRGAIGEAAFMTGMERNSDVVYMAAYAPLFVNIHHRRWNPNLINFDSAKVYGIPSYYVQQLFSAHTGTATVPVDVTCSNTEGESIAGQVGVGTWSTQAEFKDIVVTGNDGKVLYSSDFAKNAKKGWKFPTGGEWTTADGVLRQTSNTNGARAVIGDAQWKNYTLTLKARKLSGHEGFLVLFGVQGRGTNKSWWNIGGWGNKRHALEAGGIDDASVDGSIETGRWYDIKVEVKGGSVICSLDGKIIHDVKTPAMKSLYASATITKDNDEIIVKAVNVDANAQAVDIVLDGLTKVNSKAKAWVLTSDDPMAENKIDNLTKVVPVETTVRISGNTLTHTLPGNSLTVLRFGIKK